MQVLRLAACLGLLPACLVDVPDINDSRAFSCELTSDCVSGFTCIDNRCIPNAAECNTSADCSSAFPFCDGSACIFPCDSNPCSGSACTVDLSSSVGYRCGACNDNSDCAQGQVCVYSNNGDNQCVDDCSSCGGAQQCVRVDGPNNPNPFACAVCPSCGGGDVCQIGPSTLYEEVLVCSSGCQAAADCPGQICDFSRGLCIDCFNDGDCFADAPRCNASINQCVDCLSDGDCIGTSTCDLTTNTCTGGGCSIATDCPAGEVCQNSVCVDPCDPNPCGDPNQPFCIPDSGFTEGYRCAGCQEVPCPGNQACVAFDTAAYGCVPGCPSGVCTSTNDACITVTGFDKGLPPAPSSTVRACKPCSGGCVPPDTCVEQTTNTLFNLATVTCGVAGGGCTADSACVAPYPRCNIGTGQCVECLSNADCGPGGACDSTFACFASGCVNDTDCTAPTPRCETGNGVCVACFTNADCGPSEVCNPNFTCSTVSGCTADASCAAPTPRCEIGSGLCVECLDSLDCPGTTCDLATNTCVPGSAGCATNAECPNGQVCSAGSCFDPCATDPCTADPNLSICIFDSGAPGFYRCVDCGQAPCPTGQACVTRTAGAQCVPACSSGSCSNTQEACITVDGFTNSDPPVFSNTISACKPCTPACGALQGCQEQTSAPRFDDTVTGCVCDCGPDVCVQEVGGPRCASPCPMSDTPCTDAANNDGWCVPLPPDGGGAAVNACVVCNSGGGCPGSDICRYYEPDGTAPGNYSEAAADTACSCADEPGAPNWYALGQSACGNGISAVPAGWNTRPVSTTTLGRGPSLSMDNGKIIVAYAVQSPDGPEAYVRTFSTFEGWTGVGTFNGFVAALGGQGDSREPAVTASAGELYTAFTEKDGVAGSIRDAVFLTRPGGGNWVEAYPGSLSNRGIGTTPDPEYRPDIAAGQGGEVVVVWQHTLAAADTVYAGVLAGGVWNPSGTPAAGRDPRVAWGPPGTPYFVALTTASSNIHAYQYDGTFWGELDGSASGPGLSNLGVPARFADIAVISGSAPEPVVVWQETEAAIDRVMITRHVPGGWQGYTSPASTDTVGDPGSWPTLALEDDTPYVAYEGVAAGERIYVRRFDGMAFNGWDGSAIGEGLGRAGFVAARPAVATGPSPRQAGKRAVCVAWVQYTTPSQVYLRCHDL